MDDPFAGIPYAIPATVAQENPNKSFILYEGPVEIHSGGVAETASAVIRYKWLPHPQIVVRLTNVDAWSLVPGSNCSLAIPGLGHNDPCMDVTILKTESMLSEEESHTGIVNGKVWVGDPFAELKEVRFSLPNFHRYIGKPIREPSGFNHRSGRIEIAVEPWIITIDNLQHTASTIKSLNEDGGYAVTHSGRIERADRTTFNFKSLGELWTPLWRCFSFMRGFRVGPIFPTGCTSAGEPRCSEWGAWPTDSYQGTQNWFPMHVKSGFSELVFSFLSKWREESWRHVLDKCVHWYAISSLGAAGLEGSIVSAQCALELLSRYLLFENKDVLDSNHIDSEKHFRRMSASDKFRRMLSSLKLSSKIPVGLGALSDFAKSHDYKDGPHVLTVIRNSIVHGGSQKVRQNPRLIIRLNVLYDVQQLGLWYIELILLKMLGYNGEYFNRTRRNHFYVQEKMPW